MPDEKANNSARRVRINLQEDYEVVAWCKALGCTEHELRTAVKAVGDDAVAVRKFLKSDLVGLRH